MTYHTYRDAIDVALNQLSNLRDTLNDLRAASSRPEFVDSIRHFKGKMAAFQEELDDTRRYHLGRTLATLAGDSEVMADDELHSIDHLIEHEPRSEVDTAYIWLGHVWESSCLPDTFDLQAESWAASVAGGLGRRVARFVVENYDDLRGHSRLS